MPMGSTSTVVCPTPESDASAGERESEHDPTAVSCSLLALGELSDLSHHVDHLTMLIGDAVISSKADFF